MSSWIATLRRRGLVAQLSLLGVAVISVYALVAPVAGLTAGGGGLAASATAAAVCLAGAGLALTASRTLGQGPHVLRGVLFGMPLRMGIPLLGALLLQWLAEPLAEAHLLVYFLVFYPVTLFVETFLSLPRADALGDLNGVPPDDAP
jgi:hypothetical protein